MAHASVTKSYSAIHGGVANTYSYSSNFDVFKGSEVVVTLDAVDLTFTASTINESASPREYTVDTSAKTIHIGGATLSSGTIIIRPNTDLGAPTAQAIYSAGSSITASDLNNNQTQLLRKAMEYDENKLSTTGDTMTGHLTMGEDTTIIFEGATDDGYETTLTVADPTADRTITLPNVTGTVVTTGDTGTVATGMIADDAVDNDKLANSIVSAISANTSKVTNATHTGDVTGATSLTIATGAVNSAKIANGAIVNDDLNAAAAIAHTKLAAVPDGQVIVGSGSTVPTAVAISGDVTLANDGAVTIASNAVEIGMIGCEQTTISDSDSHVPTSGAVVDYVSTQLATVGGFETIATDAAFPNSQPASGIIVSIADAGGLVVNGSGVSTTGRTVGASTVTINGINSQFYSTTVAAGVAFMVESTGSGHIYNYHKATLKEADLINLSSDIDDFGNRYRIASSEPGSDNDAGDLYFNTSTDKMNVYDGSSWGEVTSTGDFKILVLTNQNTTDAPTYNSTVVAYDLKEGTTGGSAAAVTTAAQLIISVNGVIQKPNAGTNPSGLDGFVLSASDEITFCAGPPSGADVFVMQCGSAVTIPTPGDNTVTSAKIVDGAILNADINASADIAGSKLADDSIAEVKLDIHAAPSGTDKFLKYTSNGMEWVVPSYTTNTNTQLTEEQVEDFVGGMVTGNTETGITVTYEDSDGTLDFVVDDATKLPLAGGTITGPLVINDSVQVEILASVSSSNSITLDMGAACHHSIALAENTTFQDPSNEVVGQSGSIIITQDASGSRTAAWNSAFKWAGGTAPTLSTAANAVDRIDYLVVAAGNIHAVASLAMA